MNEIFFKNKISLYEKKPTFSCDVSAANGGSWI